ncbi:MAG: (d)CMP kinase [Oscillospiraceae bacterium]|nr:(d)CMP kinase [Oscillospiraceae bacterium]
MSRKFNIAIDGPSGAGKSTIARITADMLGIIYVDTGAIYRSVGLYVLRKGIDSKDRESIIAVLPEIKIEIAHDESGSQRMILNGDDVSAEIRLPAVSIYASDVSAIPEVRSFLLELQRGFAREQSTVMDGRDIGTVVLPDADLKIFLTASPEKRAMRRYLELRGKGIDTTYEDVLKDVQYRDKNDSERAVAPLRPAEDSVIIDTTEYGLEESIAMVYDLIRERMRED